MTTPLLTESDYELLDEIELGLIPESDTETDTDMDTEMNDNLPENFSIQTRQLFYKNTRITLNGYNIIDYEPAFFDYIIHLEEKKFNNRLPEQLRLNAHFSPGITKYNHTTGVYDTFDLRLYFLPLYYLSIHSFSLCGKRKEQLERESIYGAQFRSCKMDQFIYAEFIDPEHDIIYHCTQPNTTLWGLNHYLLSLYEHAIPHFIPRYDILIQLPQPFNQAIFYKGILPSYTYDPVYLNSIASIWANILPFETDICRRILPFMVQQNCCIRCLHPAPTKVGKLHPIVSTHIYSLQLNQVYKIYYICDYCYARQFPLRLGLLSSYIFVYRLGFYCNQSLCIWSYQ